MISEHPIDMPGTEHLLKIVQISEGFTLQDMSQSLLWLLEHRQTLRWQCRVLRASGAAAQGLVLLLAQVVLQAGSKG